MIHPARAVRFLAMGAAVASATLRAADLSDVKAACAKYHYREAVRLIDAMPAAAVTPEMLRYRGIAEVKMGQWEEGVTTLERALAAAPNNVDILIDLSNAQGQLALASGPFGKFSGARKSKASLERAVELGPDNVDARAGLFGYYLNVPGIVGGSRDKALEQLAALERLDAVAAQVARAELAYADKDLPRAFATYRELQRTHPDEFRAFYGLGRIAALSGQNMDEGLASLKHCEKLQAPLRMPGMPGVYLRIGDILRKKGDIAGARAAYEQSLRILPEYTFAREELDKLK